MASRRLMLTFPTEQIKEPVIYNLGHEFKIMTNIRRADVSEDKGWMVLELDGEDREIDNSIAWLTSRGIRVDPVVGDIVEG